MIKRLKNLKLSHFTANASTSLQLVPHLCARILHAVDAPFIPFATIVGETIARLFRQRALCSLGKLCPELCASGFIFLTQKSKKRVDNLCVELAHLAHAIYFTLLVTRDTRKAVEAVSEYIAVIVWETAPRSGSCEAPRLYNFFRVEVPDSREFLLTEFVVI
jgi:hypothetical protein